MSATESCIAVGIMKPSPASVRKKMEKTKRLTFWSANEDDDSLPVSVMEGRKTATSETVEEYYKP